MDKTYWLGRQETALKSASSASSSAARLIHYDLAGRYHLKAETAEESAVDLADSLPPPIYGAGSAFAAARENSDA